MRQKQHLNPVDQHEIGRVKQHLEDEQRVELVLEFGFGFGHALMKVIQSFVNLGPERINKKEYIWNYWNLARKGLSFFLMLLVYVRTSLRASMEKVNFLDDASAMKVKWQDFEFIYKMLLGMELINSVYFLY